MMMTDGNLAANHFQIFTGGFIVQGQHFSAVRLRLQNISSNLDLGYLPGNDSRNGIGGMDITSFMRTKLPKPEPPPSY